MRSPLCRASLAVCAPALSVLVVAGGLRAQTQFDRLTKDHVDAFDDPLLAPVLGDFDGDRDLDVMDARRMVINFLGRFVTAPALPSVYKAIGAHDFDGDGRADLFETSGSTAETAGISLNRLPFGFARQPLPFLPRRAVAGHAAEDFDGDGDIDLVIGVATSFEPVFQLVNDGSGHFTDETAARMPAAGAAYISAMWATDADSDGDQDLLIADRRTNRLALMINRGGGVMAAADPAPIGPGARTVLGLVDLDGDGDEDLIVEGPQALLNQAGSYVAAAVEPLPLNPYVTAVRAGDLDGDGDLDLWVESNDAEHPTWFENPGNGAAYIDRLADVPLVRRSVDQVELNDVDGDGLLDVIALSRRIEIWRGQPGGRFLNLTPELGAAWAYGDYDGDGVTDRLISTGFFRMALAKGDGVGGFTERLVSLGWTATGVLDQADVDGDGDLDLLARGPWPSNGPGVLRNDGTGTFQPIPGATPGTIDNVIWSQFGDLDGDNDLDLVLHSNPSNRVHEFAVLRNDGSGVFTADPAWQLPALHGRILVGVLLDAERDGDLDLVVGDDDPVLYLNDGNGVLTAAAGAIPGRFGVSGVRPSELSVADVDADGQLDLLASYTFQTNPGGAAEDATLFANNGDGTFRVRDVFAETREWNRALLIDVDDDGDADLVSSSEEYINGSRDARIDIRTNDGSGALSLTTLTLDGLTSISGGRFVDTDDDGDIDFVPGDRWSSVMSNLTRHLHSRLVPQLGGTLELEVANPKPLQARWAAFLLTPALLAQPQQVLDFGLLIVDPTTAIVLSRVTRFRGAPVTLSVPVPNTASLIGVDIYAQALVDAFSTPRLTNAIRETLAR